jgi:hypothetical protein
VLVVFAALFLPGYFAPPGEAFGRGLEPFLAVALFQSLLLLYLMSLRGPEALALSGVRAPKAQDLLVAMAAGAGLLAASALLAWAVSQLGGAGRRAIAPRLFVVGGGPAAIALLSLATGYREELFYRCYLVTRLAAMGVPASVAVIAAALVYAVGHAYEGPLAILLALAQGGAFGALLLRGASLHALALAHALYNFVVLFGRLGA